MRRQRWSGSTWRAPSPRPRCARRPSFLREALIGSVSHELRTPLASILGAATDPANAPALAKDERLLALAAVVRDEAERLNIDIQNLLDATTISRQQVRPKLQWVEPVDIVNAAIEHRRRRLTGYPVTLDLDSNLPIVHVDPAQVEQALIQISTMPRNIRPVGSPIRIAAHPNGRTVVLSVHDCGAGLTRRNSARSAAVSSAARATPPPRRVPGSDCGSPRPSSAPMAAGSRSKAKASIAALPFRSICPCRPRK